MKRIFFIILLGAFFMSLSGVAASDDISLRFREDGTFRIVQFADIHWSWGFGEDRQSGRLLRAVLDAETPDLVVFTGDNITGGTLLPYRALRQITEPCAERNIPWALVFGNHDDEGNTGRKRQMEILQGLPYCLAVAGPETMDGVSNYVLTVGASEHPETPAALLYFLDSLAYMHYEGQERYNHIQPSQLDWYREQSTGFRDLNAGNPLPALAFFHIPLPEYRLVWESDAVVGVKQEEVCDSPVNSGLFAIMKEMGDVMGVFVGHDHVNDYIGLWEGIYLGYGRGTGYSTYGREGFPRGARVIELIEGKREFRTWHRLEGGTKEMQIP